MKNNQYLDGFKINLVNGAKLFPNEMPEITIGEKIYRNHDQHFEQMLSSTPILRKIAVSFELTENPDGIILSAIDEENIRTEYLLKGNFSEAKDSRLANENIQKGLAKTGNSIYEVKSIKINLSKNWFLPISNINDLRRKVLLKLDELRNNTYVRQQFVISRNNFPYPDKKLDFRGNVINSYAEKFYKRHGVELIESGLELSNFIQGKVLMTAKYCLKYEMGNCPKLMKNSKEYWNEPVYLENKNTKLKLEFDCKNCEMNLKMG